MARVLIKAGGDKNARTGGSGATPLHLSARRGHEECVRILLLTGADKDARRALDGATPLHQVHFILFSFFMWWQQRKAYPSIHWMGFIIVEAFLVLEEFSHFLWAVYVSLV